MPLEQDPARATAAGADDPTLIAAAVRSGIDALLTVRAPAERDAFWQAVALLYARGSTPEEPPGPATPAFAPTRDAPDPSLSILETAR